MINYENRLKVDLIIVYWVLSWGLTVGTKISTHLWAHYWNWTPILLHRPFWLFNSSLRIREKPIQFITLANVGVVFERVSVFWWVIFTELCYFSTWVLAAKTVVKEWSVLRIILLELLYSQGDQIHFLKNLRIKFTLLENFGMIFRRLRTEPRRLQTQTQCLRNVNDCLSSCFPAFCTFDRLNEQKNAMKITS